MAATGNNTIAGTSAHWEAELTPTQWRRLEERLSRDERATLDGLRNQWLNAAGVLEAWLDPLMHEVDLSYERALAAVENAEAEFRACVQRMRRRYGI